MFHVQRRKTNCFCLLITLYMLTLLNDIQAEDEREHVHIKVLMSDIHRKHQPYRKLPVKLPRSTTLQQQQQQQQSPALPPLQTTKNPFKHNSYTTSNYYGNRNLGPLVFPTLFPADAENNGMESNSNDPTIDLETAHITAAMFDENKNRQYLLLPPQLLPPPLSTQSAALPLRQQLLQQLFTPELALNNKDYGAPVSSNFMEEYNSLPTDNLLGELQREYQKKLQMQMEDWTPSTKTHLPKRKKHDRNRERRQEHAAVYAQRAQVQSNNDNYYKSPIYAAEPPKHSSNYDYPQQDSWAWQLQQLHPQLQQMHPYQQKQQQQQQLYQHHNQHEPQYATSFDSLEDSASTSAESDDESSEEQHFGSSHSYQNVYSSYNLPSAPVLPTATAAALKWRPSQQQSHHHQQQQQQQLASQYGGQMGGYLWSPTAAATAALSSLRPLSTPTMSAVGASSGSITTSSATNSHNGNTSATPTRFVGQTGNDVAPASYERGREKRKRRIKVKRVRHLTGHGH